MSGQEGQPERARMMQVFVGGYMDVTGMEDQSVMAAGPTTPLSQGKESEAFPSP